MKAILLITSLLFTSLSYAAANRQLDGVTISNNGAIITLPTATMSMAGLTSASGSNSGDVTLGTANGLSLTGQALSLQAATASVPGALLAADFTTFAAKLTSSLANGSIFIGSAGGVATAQAVSGDITISNAGVTAIGATKVLASMQGSGASANGTVLTSNGAGGAAYLAIPSSAPALSGTHAAPTLVTAIGGVVFSGTAYENFYFLAGSAAPVTVTANPQISAATNVGQRLVIECESAVNTISLADGTGLSLNGAFVCGLASSISLFWDGVVWEEMARR